MASEDDEEAPVSLDLPEAKGGYIPGTLGKGTSIVATPVIREKADVSPPSTRTPWSLFPVAEAGRAKVSVSVLLIIGVAYGAYHLGSQRHADAITQLRSELAELKRTQDGLCRQSRVEELMNNVARDQAAMHGRIMQINADTQVLLSKTK